MKQHRRTRMISLRILRKRRFKCPECDTKMSETERLKWECPNCGMIFRRKREYSRYPDMKHDEHGAWVRAKYYRINPRVRYLKPIRRITKTKRKEYVNYIISTTVPEEWKDGVKVAIEPIPPGSSVEMLRRNERDMNELGPRVRRDAEKRLEVEEEEADRDERRLRELKKDACDTT